MVWQIWHEPLVNLSRHCKTGSTFFSELHQLGYRWHCVSSLSLGYTAYQLRGILLYIRICLYKKQSDNSHGSDMYDIYFMTTHLAKVNTMVIKKMYSCYNIYMPHMLYITQTCYIEYFYYCGKHSATLKLICENTNCIKEKYSPLSLAGTLHRVE